MAQKLEFDFFREKCGYVNTTNPTLYDHIEGELNVIPKVLLRQKITSNPIYLVFLTDFMKTKYRVIQIKLPFFFCRYMNSLHPSNR